MPSQCSSSQQRESILDAAVIDDDVDGTLSSPPGELDGRKHIGRASMGRRDGAPPLWVGLDYSTILYQSFTILYKLCTGGALHLSPVRYCVTSTAELQEIPHKRCSFLSYKMLVAAFSTRVRRGRCGAGEWSVEHLVASFRRGLRWSLARGRASVEPCAGPGGCCGTRKTTAGRPPVGTLISRKRWHLSRSDRGHAHGLALCSFSRRPLSHLDGAAHTRCTHVCWQPPFFPMVIQPRRLLQWTAPLRSTWSFHRPPTTIFMVPSECRS